jgi:hypothetical protein
MLPNFQIWSKMANIVYDNLLYGANAFKATPTHLLCRSSHAL